MQVECCSTGNTEDFIYDKFLADMQRRFILNAEADEVLFTTNSNDLWEIYLSGLPDSQRQYHNCHACRQFIQKFGGLVCIDDEGLLVPAIWDIEDAPALYKNSVRNIVRAIRRSKVTGVFISEEKVWGTPNTGVWNHFAVKPLRSMVQSKFSILNAGQKMAAKLEDYKNVQRALSTFNVAAIKQALVLLKTDALYRSEKVLGPVEWLYRLQSIRRNTNLIWKEVATAPQGFCHPRSSMAGTLLEDLVSGLPFQEVKRRFKEKMHPLQYQRPQAAPTRGNIKQAEDIVEKLGIAASLKRRFARLEEIKTIWTPTIEETAQTGGIFSHLKTKGSEKNTVGECIPEIKMTWSKFKNTVLPEALEIKLYIPAGAANFGAITTAVDSEAPPILQWDTEENRNQFSWYVWNGGSYPDQWGLKAHTFMPVSAITLKPSMWYADLEHQGEGLIAIIDGAKESRQAGLAIFPGTLRSELHPIRSTIEAFSKSGKLEDMQHASACGLVLHKGSTWNNVFRVRTDLGTTDYRLDRWD